MAETLKISTRFYNDHRVRAMWDDESNRWFFSIVDIVAAITESPNPRKYWSVLKTRLRKSGSELTTCSQLKWRMSTAISLPQIDDRKLRSAITISEVSLKKTNRNEFKQQEN